MKKNIIQVSLLFLLTIIPGCGPAIGIVMDLMPKPEIPAQFEMNDKKVLVFVSSLSSIEISPVFSHALSDHVNSELIKNDAVSSTVDFSLISDLMLNSNELITAEYAGKELNADVILKIEIQYLISDFRSNDNCRVGQVLCYLSVLDAKTGKRYWPEDKLKESMLINSKLELNTDDRLSISQIQRDLAKNAGIQIAKLFYKHKDE